MCIIVCSEKEKIDEDIFLNCHVNNPHGIGIVSSNKSGESVLHKTFSLFEAWEYYNVYVKPPYILHFRYASSGIPINTDLIHPFVIDELASLTISDEILSVNKKLLFHNGTIKNWRDEFISLIVKKDLDIKDVNKANFSDTRYAALLAYYYNENILSFLLSSTKPNKFVIWEKGKPKILDKILWQKQDEIYFSNNDYEGYEIKEVE